MTAPLRIGTRGSRLALWQAHTVAALLDAPSEIVVIRTSGDAMQEVSLQKQRFTGFFTREIERHLLDGDIDIAVHSLKDLPTETPEGLVIAAHIARGPVSDLLIVRKDRHAPEQTPYLPVAPGGRIGAGALRRQALLSIFAPETTPALIRGNVPTRLKKCREGEYDAIILARAGVERLEVSLEDFHVYELAPAIWLPAPAQGIIAVQARRDVPPEARALDDADTRTAATVERRLMASFEGGCHAAFGAWARFDGDLWTVDIGVEAAIVDGEAAGGWLRKTLSGTPESIAAWTPKHPMNRAPLRPEEMPPIFRKVEGF